MYTKNQEEQDFRLNQLIAFECSADDRNDEEKRKEEGLEDEELDEGGEWGDVDPAGGEAPTAPGSAV